MIKSANCWLGALCLAIIPLLIIDISQHALDWQHEVREEIIIAVQNANNVSAQQKAQILDRAFERNQTLYFLMYAKAVSGIVLLGMAIWFFRLYGKEEYIAKWKPMVAITTLMTLFILTKVFVINPLKSTAHIQFLQFAPGEYSFQKLYNENFKGKVVYVDFWGTTCGPCLHEFRNYTKPLKEKYKQRTDIAFLYVSQGNRYFWNEQIRKYNIEGYHVFLGLQEYDRLYKNALQDSSATVLMPRYMIVDKSGKIAVTVAHQPSETDSLYCQLDKFLN